MKAQKVDDVKFAIEQEHPADINFSIKRKKGELYLSISDIFFREGDKWYEIPLKKLQSIKVISRNPPELEFSIPALKVKVEGDYAEKLLALRHLLLPYIGEYHEEEQPIKGVVKMWGLGIRKAQAISDLLKLSIDDVRKLLTKARKSGYIQDEGVTQKGKDFLEENGNQLDKLGD
ncbi:MAG: hypothetical protein R6U61_07465 [Thermoplasmata archaeon]